MSLCKAYPTQKAVKGSPLLKTFLNCIELFRWNKPSGRLILLIPAGWSLWLTPNAPPEVRLLGLIAIGGLAISGGGCIANDLWDRRLDSKVERTKNRPLAKGSIQVSTAFCLLVLMLFVSLFVVMSLPESNRIISLVLSIIALPTILLYPSAKRWFLYPQALLAFCWGFAVLIPWAASEGSLQGGWPLLGSWLATITWSFGFDTVYAMADKRDDNLLGLQSSALNLGENVLVIVSISYALTCIFLGLAAFNAGVGWLFWPALIISAIGMQKETLVLKKSHLPISSYGRHFQNQVWLGGLILFGLILAR